MVHLARVGTGNSIILRWNRYATLLLYEFEACVHLKDWDRLNDLVDDADHCENARLVQYFGDMILRSQAPSPSAFATELLNQRLISVNSHHASDEGMSTSTS